MREDVVGDEERARLDLVAREREELLVVVLLGVEEDDVEHVVDRRQRLVRVALDELGPLLEPASAMLRRHASILRGSGSSESTRPPRFRTPAASQIVE